MTEYVAFIYVHSNEKTAKCYFSGIGFNTFNLNDAEIYSNKESLEFCLIVAYRRRFVSAVDMKSYKIEELETAR